MTAGDPFLAGLLTSQQRLHSRHPFGQRPQVGLPLRAEEDFDLYCFPLSPGAHRCHSHVHHPAVGDASHHGLQVGPRHVPIGQYLLLPAQQLVRRFPSALIYQAQGRLFQPARQFDGGLDDVGARPGRGVENDHRASGGGVHCPGQRLQALPRDLLADLLRLIETHGHLVVHLVHAAATDGIVRMILQQPPPGQPQHIVWAVQPVSRLLAGE